MNISNRNSALCRAQICLCIIGDKCKRAISLRVRKLEVAGDAKVADSQSCVQCFKLIEAISLSGSKYQIHRFAIEFEAHVIFIGGLVDAQSHRTVSNETIDADDAHATGNISSAAGNAAGAIIFGQEERGTVRQI